MSTFKPVLHLSALDPVLFCCGFEPVLPLSAFQPGAPFFRRTDTLSFSESEGIYFRFQGISLETCQKLISRSLLRGCDGGTRVLILGRMYWQMLLLLLFITLGAGPERPRGPELSDTKV